MYVALSVTLNSNCLRIGYVQTNNRPNHSRQQNNGLRNGDALRQPGVGELLYPPGVRCITLQTGEPTDSLTDRDVNKLTENEPKERYLKYKYKE